MSTLGKTFHSSKTHISSSEKIVGNTFFSSLSELSLLFTSIFYILAARYLGGTQFGKFSTAVGFVGLFILFVIFGFTYSITKVIVKERDKAGIYTGNALYVQLLFALIWFCLCMFVTFLFRAKYTPEVRWLIVIVFAAESLKSLNLTLRSSCKALGKFHFDTIAVNAERIFLVVVGGYLLIMGHGIFVAAYVLAFSRMISFILLIWFLSKSGHSLLVLPDISVCRKLVRKSWDYVIQSAFWRVYDHIDVVMISCMRPFFEVGLYRAGRQILDGLWLIPNIITEATYPELSARSLVSEQKVFTLFDRAFKYMFTISVMVSLGTVIIARYLIQLVYGPSYEKTAIVLILLGAAVIPSYLRYLFGNTLIAINLQKKETAIAASRSGFNILANLPLIYYHGFIGATIATVATDYFGLIFYIRILGKRGLLRRSQLAFICKPLAAVALIFPLYLFANSVHEIVKFFGLIFLYILLLLVFKIFDKEELSIFKEVLKSRLPRVQRIHKSDLRTTVEDVDQENRDK